MKVLLVKFKWEYFYILDPFWILFTDNLKNVNYC